MQKKCKCGTVMDLRLRTLIYSNAIEICNVPIYSCNQCFCTELLSGIKSELMRLIGNLGGKPGKQKLNFDEINEWAYLLSRATDLDYMDVSIQDIIADRIDQLLDLWLLARSLGDSLWEDDVKARLKQISNPSHFWAGHCEIC